MTEELYQHALLKFLNIPYEWGGGTALKGLDCSGFTQEALAMLGIDPKGDQTAQGLYNELKVAGAKEYCLLKEIPQRIIPPVVGCLAFYGKSNSEIIHVAPVFSKGVYNLKHATIIEAGGGGSSTTTKEIAIAQNALIRIRPILHRKDLVSILKPAQLPWEAPQGPAIQPSI